jgi:putative oxidoreductase
MSATSPSVRGDTDDILGTARREQSMPVHGALYKLVRTYDSVGPTIGRIGLGAIMFAHASQKVFGWFGGYGFQGTLDAFTKEGMPGAMAFLVILVEFLSSIALVLGLLTRLGAIGIATIMVGAIALVHAPNGFFMNWFGTQQGEGFEYHLLAISLALTLLVIGGGRVSIDQLLMHRRRAPGGGYPTAFAAP